MNYIHKLSSVLLLSCVIAPAMTSCEDMLSPSSDLVMYEEDNQIRTVHDTLYSVLGVVHLMQQVADRTNLLGEVRADLVNVTKDATTDLQDLAMFQVAEGNAYNRPEDFYAIVNNCNYFIAHADTAYTKSGRKVFERELAVMHTYRAWAYLQLATTYGSIPFYTDFLGTLDAANQVMKQPRQDLNTVCNWLIDDLQPWIDTYELDYGSMGGFQSSQFFIPVRVMLGELCLWVGRYQEAAQYYHDYLTNIDKPKPVDKFSTSWSTGDNPPSYIYDSYSSSFSHSSTSTITYIPMESNVFNGTISYLRDLYCSTQDNYYFYQLTYSRSLLQLSARQAYYYDYVENNKHDTVRVDAELLPNLLTDSTRMGDLRLFSIADISSVNERDGSRYNDSRQTIRKFSTNTAVILYRLPIIYLHYAEALNRAGFPTAAFAVLKYGLSRETTTSRSEGDPIHPNERANAGTLLSFNANTFTRRNTVGIHAYGCGDVDINPEYVMPMPAQALGSYADTVAYQQPLVEDLIIDELALEGCFEGMRYYDLLRVALRRGDVDYLASAVANRQGTRDAALYGKLQDQKNWYLPLY